MFWSLVGEILVPIVSVLATDKASVSQIELLPEPPKED